ncbi:MAG: hypothetical protein IJY21_02555 [Clostridia bacterium]|nr:hypothetical protein [Clostridia bacterium]
MAICSIAEFLICYHEKNNPYKKWERCRENKIAGISGYESKEYFLLALLSLSLFFVTVAVVVWHFITMGSFNVAVCLFMGLLDLVFLFFNIRYVILIFKATNLSKLQEERKKIKKYYKEQSETQGENMPDSCEEEKISA